jgi:hypothetical protein
MSDGQTITAISPPPHYEVRWLSNQASAICPVCWRAITQRTNICHPKNPIWDCPLGQENRPHIHHFCACGHVLVTIEPPSAVPEHAS